MACVCVSMETIVLTPRVSFGVNFRSCRGKRSISKGGAYVHLLFDIAPQRQFFKQTCATATFGLLVCFTKENIYESSSPVSAHTLRETKFLRKYGHDVVTPPLSPTTFFTLR